MESEKEYELPMAQDYAEQIINEADEAKELSLAYYEARKKHARALNKITVMIFKAGIHDNKASFENKIPMLFANPVFSDEAIATAAELNEAEHEYKGLELVLKAYFSKIAGLQSVVKYMLQGELTEATKNKYQ